MNNALDNFDFMQRKTVEKLARALRDIVDCYDARSELYTNECNIPAILVDKARAALTGIELVNCQACDGQGILKIRNSHPTESYYCFTETVTCDKCHGTGKVNTQAA